MAQLPRPEDFEVAIICALRVERDAVEAFLDEEYETDGFSYGKAPGDYNAYTTGRIGNHHVVLAYMPGIGKASSAAAASGIRTSFGGIKIGILVGICGGAPVTDDGTEILLGDVIIGETIIQVDFGRQHPNKFVRKDTLEDNLGRATPEIRSFLGRASGLRVRQRLTDKTAFYSLELCKKNGFQKSTYPGAENDKLYPAHYRHKHQNPNLCVICGKCQNQDDEVCATALNSSCTELGCDDRLLIPRSRAQEVKGLGAITSGTEVQETRKPSIHFGRIASGDGVMKCGQYRDEIVAREKVIAFEMEGAGAWDYLPMVVIKSVCDYADSHKNKEWQGYAAATAAACVKALLEEWRSVERPLKRPVSPESSYTSIKKHLLSTSAGKMERHGRRDAAPESVLSEDLFKLLPEAAEASFDCYEKQHEHNCLPGTRVDVLHQIETWADGEDERCIFWMSGLAGTGKSTIARTVARKYHEQGCLGASFFFSRGGGDVRNARKLFTSIAMQLARNSPSLHGYICQAISEHKDVAKKSLRDQWHQLVLGPLSKLNSNVVRSPRLVLVVDALDECEGDNDIEAIVQLLTQVRSLTDVKLRVFLTSRPEIPVRYGFSQVPETVHNDFILHNISPPIIEHDISIFLEANFRRIRQKHTLPEDWPGDQVIVCLVQKSSGLFIWAATAYRFISEGRRFARKRLSLLLQDNTSLTEPEKQLNEIYLTVLKSSTDNNYDELEREELYGTLRAALGIIVILVSPLSIFSLARLLRIPKDDVEQTLDGLHSILNIPKDQAQPVRLHHPSFRDFLLDKDRCSDPQFWVDEKKAHRSLADYSLQLMSENLRRDICDLRSPGALATEVRWEAIEQCLPNELQYACLYWVQHLQKSGARLHDNCQVHKFLQKHLLHWLENLSLMRKTSEGILALISLEAIVAVNESPSLHAFIHDAKRFALYNRAIIEEAPLQIYCSALIFAPLKSIVRSQFSNQIPGLIHRLPEVQKYWRALLQTLEGHSRDIGAVAFSPDGKQVASASNDRTVRLWDSATGAPLQMLEGHSGDIGAVAFSPDGKLVTSASKDRTVRLWDSATGAPLQTIEGHRMVVSAVAFSPSGKLVVSGSLDSTVRFWDSATGARVRILEGHSELINAVAFSPDAKLVAFAPFDRTVKLWNSATGAPLRTLEGHSGDIDAVAFSPDGKQVASASFDGTVRLWDSATGAPLQILDGHLRHISAVAFSPDGKQVASASFDGTVRLWDSATGAPLRMLEDHSGGITAVAFSPDGKLVASASDDGTVKLWDSATGAPPQTLEGHSWPINAVAFSPDGKLATSASFNNTVGLWDPATGAPLQMLEGHSGHVRAVAFSPNSKLVASTSTDMTVRLWDSATGAPLQMLEGHSNSVGAVAFSPDGKLVASASFDRTVRLWDSATGAPLQTLEGHSKGVEAVAFSSDSKLVASASLDSTVGLWDPATGAPVRMLEGHSGKVRAVTFSPDGKLVASASVDTVRLWDSATGAPLQMLERHSVDASAIAFSPDSMLVASASDDRTVRLWDSATGTLLQTLEGIDRIKRLSFSSDSQFLDTDRGLLGIGPIGSLCLSTTSPPPRSMSEGERERERRKERKRELYVNGAWVVRGGENVLWLPPEYRATCAAVRDNILMIGHASGHVSTLEFDAVYG